MSKLFGQHADLAAELSECWEDLRQRRVGSRIVLVKVPNGWGRSTVLDHFEAAINDPANAPVTRTLRINGRELPEDIGLQAAMLRDRLTTISERHRAMEVLGLDKASGSTQLALGVTGLFFSGLTAGVSFLVAGLAVGAMGRAWDDSPAGMDGALGRAARAVAALSVHVPVAVILDDADAMNPKLVVTMAENLATRHDGQVLVVATMRGDSDVASAFSELPLYLVAEGHVQTSDAKPNMDFRARLEIVREICPRLPERAARRIAQSTRTFAEVFTITAAPRLAEVTHQDDPTDVLAATAKVIDARLNRPAPSMEAVVVAWAGGLIHARQARRALDLLGEPRAGDNDPDIRRLGACERVPDPKSNRLVGQAAALATNTRAAIAEALLEEALAIATDSRAGLADRAAALLAAHQVRDELTDRARLPGAQRGLAAALEALGAYGAAYDVAKKALTEWPANATDPRDWDALAAAVLRLNCMSRDRSPGPLEEQIITDAIEGGALAGLEARVWAAATLLDTPGQREAALGLAGQVIADLEGRTDLEEAGDQWRLILAAAASRARFPDIAAQVLAPLLASEDPARYRPARMIQYAGQGPNADIRLQNILLAEGLTALPANAEDDQLRIHYALAANYATLGEYRQALEHGQHEFVLRVRIQGPGHPDTLVARANIADWIGQNGDTGGALVLLQEILPDLERVLGPHHRNTLIARANIAMLIGRSGHAATARQLYESVRLDAEKFLGPRDMDTLSIRSGAAYWTGESGHPDTARQLYQQLLSDQEHALGRYHRRILDTRINIAHCIEVCGDPGTALGLYQEVLPDLEFFLGSQHRDTLGTRVSMARCLGQRGDPGAATEAMGQLEDLLPQVKRILGPDHPDTLATRYQLAYWTGICGGNDKALAQFKDLLNDEEPVLGSQNPSTLDARYQIAKCTFLSGNHRAALIQLKKLLPEMELVYGPHHPGTVATRVAINRLARRKSG